MKKYETSAEISDCHQYRYQLARTWNPHPGQLIMTWVMLNPSTADAFEDDPTIRRCMGFAKREGFDGIEVVNLFAYRATDPKVIQDLPLEIAVGPDNDDYIRDTLARSHMVVGAWGANPTRGRAKVVYEAVMENMLVTGFYCLGRTKDGSPRHPLYVKATAAFELWHP